MRACRGTGPPARVTRRPRQSAGLTGLLRAPTVGKLGGSSCHGAQSFLQRAQTAGVSDVDTGGGERTEGEEDEEADASSPVTAQHVTSPPRRLRLCLSHADLETTLSGSCHWACPFLS